MTSFDGRAPRDIRVLVGNKTTKNYMKKKTAARTGREKTFYLRKNSHSLEKLNMFFLIFKMWWFFSPLRPIKPKSWLVYARKKTFLFLQFQMSFFFSLLFAAFSLIATQKLTLLTLSRCSVLVWVTCKSTEWNLEGKIIELWRLFSVHRPQIMVESCVLLELWEKSRQNPQTDI